MRAFRSTLGLCVVALVAACSSAGGAGASPATSAGQPGRVLAGNPLAPCVIHGDVPVAADADGLCGTLWVPVDRSNSGGPQIGLRVAVVQALAAEPAADPFVAIAGGPGDAGTQFFAWLPGLYADVHATHDIVLVDQRGTGDSHPMVTPALPDVSGLTAAEVDTVMRSWAHDALPALDRDPRLFTSTVAADDLDAVRAALGYDQVDLYGTSYGGTLAQYYLRQHADRVRVAVLDGSTPLAVPVLERMAANSQHALDLLLERCAQDERCHAAFPNLAGEWASLRMALAAGIPTSVVDPTTGEAAVADLAMVGPALHHALLTNDAAGRIPLAIHEAATGHWEHVGELVPPVAGGGDGLAMAAEILCSEAWARYDPDEVVRDGIGGYALPWQVANAKTQAALCRAIPAGVTPVDDSAPAPSVVPTLWLTGDGDPQDPPANLSGVDVGPDGAIVVVPAQEHVVGHLGCGPQVIAAFVDAGTARGLDTSCLAGGSLPAWTLALP